jgi:hypothetical protein
MPFDTQLIKLNTNADLIDVVSDTVIYEGFCNPGKFDTSQPVWKIIRRSQTGTVWAREYAAGRDNYSNIWDNRAGLSYSFLI